MNTETNNSKNSSLSKLNAIKHGLLAKSVIVSPEESRPFNKLAKQLYAELDPQNVLENILAEQIILQYWRLRRFLKVENELLIFGGTPKYPRDAERDFIPILADFLKDNNSLELLTRYNSSILRSFYKAIHEYKTIKSGQSSTN